CWAWVGGGGVRGVLGGGEEMKGGGGVLADDPAVMGLRRDEEEGPRRQLPDAAILERRRGASLEHEPDVLHAAARRTDRGAHVHGPAPAGLVRRASDRRAANRDELEAPPSELTDLVGRLEPPEDDVDLRNLGNHFEPPDVGFPAAPAASRARATNSATPSSAAAIRDRSCWNETGHRGSYGTIFTMPL